MHRAYCSQFLPSDNAIRIEDPEEFHHLRDVLRLKEGAELEVTNGQGLLARVRVQVLEKRAIVLEVIRFEEKPPSLGPRIILACAIPKKSKFETIIEKATELGVDEIIPMITERTELRPSVAERKDGRFQKVVLNASKQSKRVFFPVLHPVTDFEDVLARFALPGTLTMIPWLEGERLSFHSAIEKEAGVKTILILIGPEGDFTPLEASLAIAKGAVPVSLGETVLKVDTAAISVVAALRLGRS